MILRLGGLLVGEAYFPFINKRCHFLTVDAKIGNQAFQNRRCHICFCLGLDMVETGHNRPFEEGLFVEGVKRSH